jgi:hypothetical protein
MNIEKPFKPRRIRWCTIKEVENRVFERRLFIGVD